MASLYNRIAGQSLDRIAALSDGLFAFAMTVLVLDVHVPPHASIHNECDLWYALVALGPQIVTYLMTFTTLGIFWTGQQTQLNQLERADRNLGWIHIAFLAAVSMTPFTTSLLAEFITYRLALAVYWANILLLGVILYATWSYAEHAKLVKEDTDPAVPVAIRRRIIVAQALYAFGAMLCLINTYCSIGFIVLVQLNYAIAPRIKMLSRLTA